MNRPFHLDQFLESINPRDHYNDPIGSSGDSGNSSALADQPTDVSCTPNGSFQVDLTWTNSDENATIYIYRGTSATGPFTYLTSKSPGSTSHSDTGLSPETSYYYKVYSFGTGVTDGVDANDTTS